jgi:thiosulfate dehydrogenase [quinone] large subunit
MAPALLRWALGLLFLVGGLAKLPTVGGFVQGYLVPAFEKTFLPKGLVAAYGYALPFVEVVLGVLLILGLCRHFALLLSGLTLLSLGFGQMLLKEHGTVANICLYVLMTAAALYMGECDCWVVGRSRPQEGERPPA